MAKENAMEEERREQKFNEVIEPYVPDLLARGISREIAFKMPRDELAMAARGTFRLVSRQAREDRR